VLWRTPFPVTEAVAIFEDAARRPTADWLIPEQAYYRPLFYMTVATLWRQAGSLDAVLASIKLLQILPALAVVVILIRHVRPRTAVEAGAACIAVAVLIGSPGFADNLELPLSYTIVGMPIALLVWVLLNGEARVWRTALAVALTVVAIGFKEQGLVVVAVACAAWWGRAPGATRGGVIAFVVLAAAYLAARLVGRQPWAMFEQAVGFGFVELDPADAEARFGRIAYLIYAYSSASTIANVLFAEPSRGVFRVVHALVEGRVEAWQMLHVLSSTALTALIAWWGIGAIRGREWSYEGRLFLALLAALLACAALSFNYSRPRLGGMAVPFYAAAAFFATREAAARVLPASRLRVLAAAAGLLLLAAAWQLRAVGTIEHARAVSLRNHREWLALLPERRLEFKDRPVYLAIMNSMIEQGTAPDPPRPTRYPAALAAMMGRP
jgi:hypothetical protein